MSETLSYSESTSESRESAYKKEKQYILECSKGDLGELKQECSIEKYYEKESDLKEILDKTVNEIINNYLKDINSREGIDLSREGIYGDLIDVLDGLSNSLDKDNVFKKDIELIKNNFLLPKEKGISLVDFSIREKFSQKDNDKEFLELNENNASDYFLILESFFGTLYDIGSTKTQQELTNYLEEFKNYPQVKEMFEKFPDLKKLMFEVAPGFINSSSKEVFLLSLNTFLSSIKVDLINFSQYLNGKNIDQKGFDDAKLNVLNSTSKFLRSLLNEKSVDNFSKSVTKLSFISKNPVLSDILDIVNQESFLVSDKLELSDKVLEGIELFSKKELNDDLINEYINSLIGLISKVSKNVSNDRLFGLINKLKGGNAENADLNMDVSLEKLGEYLWRNRDNLLKIGSEIVNKFLNGENISLNTLIVELFKNDTISKNLSLLGKELVEDLRKIAKVDLTKYALEFRQKLLAYNMGEGNEDDIGHEKSKKLKKLEGDLINTFGGKLENSVLNLLKTKLESKENNNLKKSEIIKLVLGDLKGFLNENTTLVFEYAKELGFDIEGKQNQKNIIDLISKVLDNPKLSNIISKVVENLGKNISGKGAVVKELDLLIKDTLKNKGGKLVEGIGGDSKDLLVDTLYNQILGDREIILTMLDTFGKDISVIKEIDENTLVSLSNILRKHIKKEKIRRVLDKVDINNPLKGINELGIDLYNSIDDKIGFINELLESGIVESVNKKGGNNEKIELKSQDINLGIDLLYTTLESSGDKKMSETLNNILKKVGLNDMASLTVLGKNLGENIVSFLKSVDKKDLKRFLARNNGKLNSLLNEEIKDEDKLVTYSNLSTDLLKIVDIKKFQSEYKKGTLDSNESLALDLADEFKEVISEKGDLINTLVSKGKDIYDVYTGKIDIKNVNPEMIKMYGRQVFDLLYSVIAKIDDTYLEKNINIGDGGGENKIVDMFVSSFMGENKWFIFKEGISGVFSGFDFNIGSSLDNYFRDSDGNRENFGETLYSFLEEKQANK